MERGGQPGCEHGEAAGALRLRLHLLEQGAEHHTPPPALDTSYVSPGSGLPRGLGHSRLPHPHRPRCPREEGGEGRSHLVT